MMLHATFSKDLQDFVHRLDQAAQAHMEWTRRVLRCAVLRTSPGEDVLAEDAHLRCRFGGWFRQYREPFDVIDAVAAERLDEQHRLMHGAVRSICQGIFAGTPGDPAALDTFERTQASVIADLALRHVATVLRAQCRTGEPLFRFGGEEFLTLLHAQRREGAEQATERLLQALRDTPLRLPGGHTLSLRASAGLAEAGEEESMPEVLERADQALYAAKAAGRDNWQWAPAGMPGGQASLAEASTPGTGTVRPLTPD